MMQNKRTCLIFLLSLLQRHAERHPEHPANKPSNLPEGAPLNIFQAFRIVFVIFTDALVNCEHINLVFTHPASKPCGLKDNPDYPNCDIFQVIWGIWYLTICMV